ncbi:MAG: universal stress protein [Chitinophagaceae bacterium]|nr:universal stress protein [Chitinophagaceae bacterium]
MKTIIISTDFSAAATNAMNYAIDMAKAINASVLLFHVYQVPVSISDTPVLLLSVDDLKKMQKKKLQK